ncbi:hypothetical protein V6Z11_A07G248800 [Gossypium hirsutum]
MPRKCCCNEIRLPCHDKIQILGVTSKNYLSWILDVEIHLHDKGFGKTIVQGNQEFNQDKAKTIIFLHHHLNEGLKAEYLIIKDPLELWNNMEERYKDKKIVILPRAHYDCMHIKLKDF